MDLKVREDATAKDEPTSQTQPAPKQRSIEEILPQGTEYYCIVDASWKSPSEKIDIGWSLFSKEGIPRLQGNSAMESTNTSLEAEAMAMWSTIQQIHRYNYEKVAFLGDSMEIARSYAYIQEIKSLAANHEFSFHYVPRNFVSTVDQLAKKARINNQQYVIFWYN
ncbi:hypothetical protein Rs2_14201 [Raphanus sativus]|uniref:Uncharacterized protein LOC108850202 n=1 Tax=Raphanus sativus TaxID=3726 RepID=A0A6J0N5U3_RAPSA|nr:uncharacterized protein LOC108850202 [Raphanus sativus]KAJ4900250.1 hypothetical protein Rs2_14201 [Raphanus sativus]